MAKKKPSPANPSRSNPPAPPPPPSAKPTRSIHPPPPLLSPRVNPPPPASAPPSPPHAPLVEIPLNEPIQFPPLSGSNPSVSSGSAPPSRSVPLSKTSWSAMVEGSNRKMKRKGEFFLLESGEICVSIPNSVIEKNEHRWESFIIAQFHGKASSPGALHAISNGIWSSKLRNITVSKLSKKAFLIKNFLPNNPSESSCARNVAHRQSVHVRC